MGVCEIYFLGIYITFCEAQTFQLHPMFCVVYAVKRESEMRRRRQEGGRKKRSLTATQCDLFLHITL